MLPTGQFLKGAVLMGSDLKANLIERVKDTDTGVYVMKDSSGRVIYVGKASSLRNRVRSYFQSSQDYPRDSGANRPYCRFQYIVTDSEVER